MSAIVTPNLPPGKNTLIGIASVIIIIGGIKLGQGIIVPFLLAIFISILAVPVLFWLKRKRLPHWLALLIIIGIICGMGAFIAFIISTFATDFSENIPFYEEKLTEKMAAVEVLLQKKGVDLNLLKFEEMINPSSVIQFASDGFNQIGHMLTKSLLILLIVVFILIESTTIKEKFSHLSTTRRSTKKQVRLFVDTVNRYMLIKTTASLVTGTLITGLLYALGIHYPILWGFLAFLLNFVPNVGSIIAALPVLLLAVIQYDFSKAGMVAIAFLAVNFFIGNILEPRFMGRGLGLSTVIILISLIFWGWVFGPIGMLLAIPLTMVVKIGLANDPKTKWVAYCLGSSAEETH
ncbi:MAG: AI-2 transport protein TqsA [Candidatus Marinamargulisbacteria bacterium]|jgi:AI-2 transport protein TqsA